MKVERNRKSGVTTFWLRLTREEVGLLMLRAARLESESPQGRREWYLWKKVREDCAEMLRRHGEAEERERRKR